VTAIRLIRCAGPLGQFRWGAMRERREEAVDRFDACDQI